MSFFSWCQIVRFIMLVPNCPGAKLSGAKLSLFIILVPICPGAKLPGAKLSYHQFFFFGKQREIFCNSFNVYVVVQKILRDFISLGPKPPCGRRTKTGLSGKDTVLVGTFWCILNVSLHASVN